MATLEAVLRSQPILRASELYRFYHTEDEEVFALRGVSISVNAGEVVAVVGPSGSGKSTLLACLAGLDEPDGGFVAIADFRITRRHEAVRDAMRARWVGMLLQSGNLIEHLTVSQNIKIAQHLYAGRRLDVSDLLAMVGLTERASAWPSSLSGGEAARAGLAVAVANDPPILLADEPTAEVDAENEAIILDLLKNRAAQGKAVVVVTHSERVAQAADRVIHLADGRNVYE